MTRCVNDVGDSISGAEPGSPPALALAAEHGLTYVHPFADPAVIAGQGTIALEILAERPDTDVIVVQLSGGGLLAGIAMAAKSINPDIQVIGVSLKQSPAMLASLDGKLKSGPMVRTRSVTAFLGESQIAGALREIQDRFPTVDLGSYPFFKQDRYGTSLVMRGTDETLLDQMLESVKAAIVAAGETPQDVQHG